MQTPADRRRHSLWLETARVLRALTVGAGIVHFVAAMAVAQPPGGDAGAGEGVTFVTSTRSWIFDGLIVGALFALALVVICRSSRRN
ncbi:MAG: hypothetical protein KF861_17645 [Planctomycetaceae bacterium]|nr:hypothetical protein [Planctomycetaceae bacterium]